MPNKTIYLNTIKDMEKNVGFSFINKDELAKTLQSAWKDDTTDAKVNYLDKYRKIFRGALNVWAEREMGKAFYARSEEKADLKRCLVPV